MNTKPEGVAMKPNPQAEHIHFDGGVLMEIQGGENHGVYLVNTGDKCISGAEASAELAEKFDGKYTVRLSFETSKNVDVVIRLLEDYKQQRFPKCSFAWYVAEKSLGFVVMFLILTASFAFSQTQTDQETMAYPYTVPQTGVEKEQEKTKKIQAKTEGRREPVAKGTLVDGTYIVAGGRMEKEDKSGYVVTRTYDPSGKEITRSETTIGARTLAPTKQETDASLGFIKAGAKVLGDKHMDECSWTAANPTNNMNKADFWLDSRTIDAYCEGVLSTAEKMAPPRDK